VEDVSGLRCRLVVHPGPRPSISLGFELENTGAEPWAGRVLEPIVPWDLRAWADGHEIAVRQPALDLPLRPRSIRLEPAERVELACPIVLVFEPDGTADDGPFVWTLAGPPATVELDGTITIGGNRCPLGRTEAVLA
jgi:hypothetical protein